jgi:hypothetical protein
MTNVNQKCALCRAFLELLPQLDHWILLRFPLFWRTRVLYFLFALSSAWLVASVLLYLVFSNMYIVAKWGAWLNFFVEFWSVTNWTLVSIMLLYAWIISIIVVKVGEIPLRWHFTTIYTTVIGAYICIMMSSILPYSMISAIKHINIADDEFSSDMSILSSYDRWRCVPETVVGNSDEFGRLEGVLARYGQTITFERSATKRSNTYCEKSEFPLINVDVIENLYSGIAIIKDSRKIDADANSERNYNIFKGFGVDIYGWSVAVAVLFGLIITASSYPWYVWRRIIWRR